MKFWDLHIRTVLKPFLVQYAKYLERGCQILCEVKCPDVNTDLVQMEIIY